MAKPKSTRTIPRKISQADLLAGAPQELLRRKLLEIRADRELARSKGSFSAVASLHRLEAEILRHCVAHEAQVQTPDALDTLTDAELEALAAGSSGDEGVPLNPPLRLVAK